MGQRWNVAWLGLLFVLVWGVRSGQGAVVAPSVAPSPSAPLPEIIAFVGNNVVDLRWDTVAAEVYEVTRNGGVAGCTPQVDHGAGKVFCRDAGLVAGEPYAYRVEAVNGDERTMIGEGTVTTGFVRGVLYESLSWNTPGETYSLDGQVRVTDGAVLSIGSNVGVDKWDSPSEAAGIETDGSGGLQVISASPPATISTIYLRLHADNDIISGAEERGVVLDDLAIRLTSGSLFHNCSFTGGSVEIVEGAAPSFTSGHFSHTSISVGDTVSSVIFQEDHFESVTISVEGTASPVNFENARFDGTRDFWVHDGGNVTITESVFNGVWMSGLEVGANSIATLSNNTFSIVVGEGLMVWPSAGAEVTLQENTFRNPQPDAGNMISIAGSVSSRHRPEYEPTYVNSTIIAEDNLFLAAGAASIMGGIDLEARNNTVAQGGFGFRINTSGDPSGVDLGTVSIHSNCIATQMGLAVSTNSATNVDAARNWWGAASGPNAPGNPEGGGADIEVTTGNVSYANWLQEENCAVPWRDLAPANIEAVQVVQTWDNQVPLVAGKSAVVRVYPTAYPGETEDVSGELTVMRDGATVGTLQPTAPMTVREQYGLDAGNQSQRRASPDSSLFFKVPAAWVGGSTMTFSVEINADRAYEEYDYSDNVIAEDFAVLQRPPVSLGIVPTDYEPVDVPPDAAEPSDRRPNTPPAPQTILSLSDLFQKIYPGSDVEVMLMPSLRWPHRLDGHGMWPKYRFPGGAFFGTLGLSQMRLEAEGGVTQAAPDLIYGAIAPQDWDFSVLYESFMEPLATSRAVASYGKSFEHLFAYRQLGYLGMWGMPTTPIVQSEPGDEYCYFYDVGYDVAQDRIMGYGYDTCSVGAPDQDITDPDRYWITAEHYQRLLDYVPPGDAPASAAPVAEETYIAVLANISGQDEVELLPAWQFSSETPPHNPPVGSGAYCVELRDAAEDTIVSRCFDLAVPVGSLGWDHMLVALPLTGDPARVVILREAEEIAHIPVTAYTPQVTITTGLQVPGVPLAPQSTLTLNWTASDGDAGDELEYSVLVSPDNGQRWLPVTANIEATTFDLDLSEIPAGAQVLVRVEASDGFNVGHADYGPFALQNHGPEVLILSPENGAAISPTASLSAIVYDREEGVLQGGALRWTSDVDGDLGIGALLFPQALSEGQHTLTLTATDSEGARGTASILVNVGDGPPPSQGVYLPIVVRP